LELPSESKDQFGFVFGEFSKLEHAILATELAILLHSLTRKICQLQIQIGLLNRLVIF